MNVTVHGDEDQVNSLFFILSPSEEAESTIQDYSGKWKRKKHPLQELLSPTESDNEDFLPTLSSVLPNEEVTFCYFNKMLVKVKLR